MFWIYFGVRTCKLIAHIKEQKQKPQNNTNPTDTNKNFSGSYIAKLIK